MEDEPRDDAHAAAAFLAARRARLERRLARRLAPPAPSSLPAERLGHLLDEARELYWNELSWEQLTSDEREGGSQRVEYMFPGFLALVDALLLGEADDARRHASYRPGVVERVLRFLAARCVAAPVDRADSDAALAVELTRRLIDLVLYRLHELCADEIERAEIARLEGDE